MFEGNAAPVQFHLHEPFGDVIVQAGGRMVLVSKDHVIRADPTAPFIHPVTVRGVRRSQPHGMDAAVIGVRRTDTTLLGDVGHVVCRVDEPEAHVVFRDEWGVVGAVREGDLTPEHGGGAQ